MVIVLGSGESQDKIIIEAVGYFDLSRLMGLVLEGRSLLLIVG